MPCMPAAEAAAAHRLIERLLSRHRPLPGRSCVALLGWLCETPFRSERKLTPPQFCEGTGTNTYLEILAFRTSFVTYGSAKKMDKLGWDFIQQQKHNRDGSYATQAARSATLSLSARQLRELGYRNLRVNTVGQRHLRALVQHWQVTGVSPATIKNRMAHLRWSCEKAGRSGVAKISNDELGIARRSYIAKESRARELPQTNFNAITDPYVRFSLRLQAEFGLRREESIKFISAVADQGGHIALKSSWTKGGKPREVPIRTRSQEDLLSEVHAFTKGGSLIPSHLSYKQQLKRYEHQIAAAGLSKMHGLRHLYAQQRYLELTGKQAPAVTASINAQLIGGREHGWLGQVAVPTAQTSISPPLNDREARLLISHELGHERIAITSTYLGSTKS